VGWVLGLVFRLGRFRSIIIQQNLAIAYPGTDPESIQIRRDLYREAYLHLGNLILEIFLVFGGMKYFIRKNVTVKGLSNWNELHSKNKGVIIISSHVGNWEIMSTAAAQSGMPVLIVTKHLKPEWFHLEFERARKRNGVLCAFEPKTMRGILGHLKKKHTVGFIVDQYAGPPVGIRVPFFGVPVGTMTAIAAIAKRNGCLILPAVHYRGSGGRMTLEFSPEVPWITDENPNREIALNTAQFASVIEGHIRQHPEQWLWTHRRFKGDLSPLKENEWDGSRVRNGG